MITPTHAPMANYSVIVWAAACSMKWCSEHGSTLLRDHWTLEDPQHTL